MNRVSNLLGRLCQAARKDPSVTSAACRRSCPAKAGNPWFLRFLHFPHNLPPVSVLYSGERPEMSPHDEESKKAKQENEKIESKNKERNQTYEHKINKNDN
jgi:hypothetical protein